MFTYHCPTTHIHTYRYRYKGVMSVKGMHEKFVFQGVGMLFSGGFTGARWKRHESREVKSETAMYKCNMAPRQSLAEYSMMEQALHLNYGTNIVVT